MTKPSLTVTELETRRFVEVCNWHSGGKRGIILDQKSLRVGPGVYAFVVEGIAQYVGKTTNILVMRMDNYRDSPQEEHVRNRRSREKTPPTFEQAQNRHLAGIDRLFKAPKKSP